MTAKQPGGKMGILKTGNLWLYCSIEDNTIENLFMFVSIDKQRFYSCFGKFFVSIIEVGTGFALCLAWCLILF